MEISYFKKKYPLAWGIFSRFIPFLTVVFILLFILSYFLSKFYKLDIFWWLVGFLFITFYVWWLIRWLEYVTLVLSWIMRYKNFQKLNIQNIFNENPISKLEKSYFDKYINWDLKAKDVYHWLIVPTFNDPVEMIDEVFENIQKTDYDNKKILITLAWEANDKENFEKIKNQIEKKYKNTFWYLNFTLHKLQPGEIQGKGSNIKFAAKSTYKDILNIVSKDKVLVHTLDSESIVQKNYFSAMTLEFCLTDCEKRHKTIYQPMLFLINRFFEAPYFSKIIALSVWAYILWGSIKWIWTRTQAVQAQSLKSLLEIDFYSAETITEDWHQYYRSYCWFNWDFQVKPVYSYVLLEPVIWKNILETIKLQYNQIRRWAHWCLDLPYLVLCFYEKFNRMPKLRTFYEIFWLIEASVLWWSLQFILFFWTFFLYFSWNDFWQVLILFNWLAFLILLILLLISYWFFPFKVLNTKKKIYEVWKYSLFTFTLMWPLLLLLNWLPALHTQVMILLWKPMGKFNVTKKYR